MSDTIVTGLYNKQSELARRASKKALERSGLAADRLATGLRITSPSVDASGFVRASTLRALSANLDQAGRNVFLGRDLLETTITTMVEISNLLTNMRTLSSRANTDALDTDAIALINAEFDILREQATVLAATIRTEGTSKVEEDVEEGAGSNEVSVR